MHGPPGTGKTLLAKACANQTDAVFLKLAGPQLVQMFIGDGAKMVLDAFALAKEKAKGRKGAIIFIDEVRVAGQCRMQSSGLVTHVCRVDCSWLQLDAIGTKRFSSDQNGDREVGHISVRLAMVADRG